MKQLLNVFRFEFTEMLKRKAVIISTVIIAVIGFAATFAPTLLMNSGTEEDPQAPTETETVFYSGIYIENQSVTDEVKEHFYSMFDVVTFVGSKDLLQQWIQEERINSGFVIHELDSYTYYSKDESIFSDDKMIFEEVMRNMIVESRFEEAGIDQQQVIDMQNVFFKVDNIQMGKTASNGMFIAYVILFIMYMLILLYGQTVATSVAREKDSRTMELLITSTKPKTLILGKVLAMGALGILQVSIILILFLIGFNINKGNYPVLILTLIQGSMTFDVAMVYILFSVSGYILYLFIFAALGSLVSKVEDVNSVVQPITYIFVIAYMIASFAMQLPASTVVKVSSYIPFVSIFTMPIRNMLTTVGGGEIVVSMIIMILVTFIMAWGSIYIYRFGSLNYGNRIKLSTIFKSLKKR